MPTRTHDRRRDPRRRQAARGRARRRRGRRRPGAARRAGRTRRTAGSAPGTASWLGRPARSRGTAGEAERVELVDRLGDGTAAERPERPADGEAVELGPGEHPLDEPVDVALGEAGDYNVEVLAG